MDKTVAVPWENLPKKIEYTYDNVGNITQRKETDDLNNVTTFTMTYDSADRLTQVAPTPGTTVTYSYDLKSNMIGDSYTDDEISRLEVMSKNV
jgi:YD repeat-containing protein